MKYPLLASCEILLDVFVDRYDDDSPDIVSDLLLEPVEDFLQKFPVVMAPTLVDICQDVTNKVRILNPFNKKVTISQDTIIGEAEKLINEPKILIEFEDTTEINNFDQVRRLKVQEKSNPVQWETNTGIIRNISKKGTADGGKSGIVPPHLQDLFQKSTEECSPEESQYLWLNFFKSSQIPSQKMR